MKKPKKNNFFKIGKKVLSNEIKALTEVSNKISEDEFNEFLDKYLKDNKVDLFDPDELNLDSDKGSNIIKFRPKGTMH